MTKPPRKPKPNSHESQLLGITKPSTSWVSNHPSYSLFTIPPSTMSWLRSILRTTTLSKPSSLLTHLRLMSNLPENTVYSGPTPQTKRVTLSQLRQKHKNSQPITMVTAYDYPSAVHLDMANIDICLVGDSASMVVHGHDTTLPITLDEMLVHCRAVSRGAKTPLLVGDLPFGTYECSSKQVCSVCLFLLLKDLIFYLC